MSDLRDIKKLGYAGWTFYISIGEDSGVVRTEWNNIAKRLVIRKFVMGFVRYDMECMLERQLEFLKYYKNKLDELEGTK